MDDVDGGKLYGLVKYYSGGSTDSEANGTNGEERQGRTEYEPFTQRQRALVQAPRCMMGRHIKLVVVTANNHHDNNDDNNHNDNDNQVSGKEFFMPWFGDEAQMAYDDITNGEPCISLDSDRGVFVSTRIKRKHCANLPGTVTKSMTNLMEYIQHGLQPDHPLPSIAWNAHDPPTVKTYNVVLTGVWPTTITHHLDTNVAMHTNTTSMHEIYDAFEKRRNTYHITQAEALITKMLTEIAKGHTARGGGDDDGHNNNNNNGSTVHSGSMKDLATARRNALLKRVYIDSSKHKFIQSALEEGKNAPYEMIVVHCRPPETAGKFEAYGGVVFETFYKLDLSIYG